MNIDITKDMNGDDLKQLRNILRSGVFHWDEFYGREKPKAYVKARKKALRIMSIISTMVDPKTGW